MASLERNQPDGGGRAGTEASRPRRYSYATLALLFVALVLVLDAVAGERGWLANRRAERQCQEAQRLLDQVKRSNAAARDEARRMKSDPAAIEEVARRDLGLMKPGEKVFIVRDVAKADGK